MFTIEKERKYECEKKMRKIIGGCLNNNINMYAGSFFLFLPAKFYALTDFTQRKEGEY